MKNNYFKFIINIFLVLVYILYFSCLYKLIGESGGILYIYVYSPIIVFLILFLVGVPISVSNSITKSHILGHIKNREKTFNFLKLFYIFLSFILFFVIMSFADSISYFFLNNKSISLGIKITGSSLIFASILGVYRGYFIGINHKEYSTISKIIEYFIKFIIVIILYLITIKFKISLNKILNIIFTCNTFSYLASFIYLVVLKNKKSLNKLKKEPKLLKKIILKENILQTLINCIIFLFISFCFIFDLLSLNTILVDKLNYTASSSENIIGSIILWGNALNLLFIGIIIRLLKDFKSIINKYILQKDINKIGDYISNLYKKILFFSLPISIFVCFCATSIWNILYENSKYGTLAYHYFGILIFIFVIFIVCYQILILLKQYRVLWIGIITGLLIKILFNNSMIFGINKLGFPAFYGTITATFLAGIVASIIAIAYINSKYKIRFESIVKEFFNIVTASIIMLIALMVINRVVIFETNNNIIYIVSFLIKGFIASSIYIFLTYKFDTIKNIFK